MRTHIAIKLKPDIHITHFDAGHRVASMPMSGFYYSQPQQQPWIQGFPQFNGPIPQVQSDFIEHQKQLLDTRIKHLECILSELDDKKKQLSHESRSLKRKHDDFDEERRYKQKHDREEFQAEREKIKMMRDRAAWDMNEAKRMLRESEEMCSSVKKDMREIDAKRSQLDFDRHTWRKQQAAEKHDIKAELAELVSLSSNLKTERAEFQTGQVMRWKSFAAEHKQLEAEKRQILIDRRSLDDRERKIVQGQSLLMERERSLVKREKQLSLLKQ